MVYSLGNRMVIGIRPGPVEVSVRPWLALYTECPLPSVCCAAVLCAASSSSRSSSSSSSSSSRCSSSSCSWPLAARHVRRPSLFRAENARDETERKRETKKDRESEQTESSTVRSTVRRMRV